MVSAPTPTCSWMKSLIYEYSRIALEIILLIFFLFSFSFSYSHVWFYPSPLIHLVFRSWPRRQCRAWAPLHVMSSLSWHGPHVKPHHWPLPEILFSRLPQHTLQSGEIVDVGFCGWVDVQVSHSCILPSRVKETRN